MRLSMPRVTSRLLDELLEFSAMSIVSWWVIASHVDYISPRVSPHACAKPRIQRRDTSLNEPQFFFIESQFRLARVTFPRRESKSTEGYSTNFYKLYRWLFRASFSSFLFFSSDGRKGSNKNTDNAEHL